MKHLFVTQQYDYTATPVGNTAIAITQEDHYKYVVDKVVNSLNPPIKSTLDPIALQAYIIATDWKVTIT